MKTTFFSFLLVSLLFVGCTTEETNEQTTETNQSANLETSLGDERSDGFYSCDDIPCVEDYTYPTMLGGQTTYHVYYDSDLTLGEIECIRQKFFNCFDTLRWHVLQPTNSHQDFWTTLDGKPHTSITNAICTDPETGLTIQCQ